MLTENEKLRFAELCSENAELHTLYEKFMDTHRYAISRIAHEIRNPVTLINSFLQLYEQEHPEAASSVNWLHAQENMKALRHLLSDLSEYNNAHTLHLEMVNLYCLLSAMASDAASGLCPSSVSLVLKKDSAIPSILEDVGKMRQVFLNLIQNAVEAMPNGGTLTISIESDGDSITIHFTDTGCGIEPEQLSSIFDPFVTHKRNGTGLGLAVSKEIISAHHGSISAESVPGKGTDFTIRLPVR